MRARGDPARWPAAIGLTLVLVLVLPFVVPRSWLAFLAPRPPTTTPTGGRAAPWLVLLPPPGLEIAPATEPPAPEPEPPADRPRHQDPRWWLDGVAVGATEDPALFGPQAVAAADSVEVLLAALGLGEDFTTRARPDSVLAARLALLRVHDTLRYDELKPLLRHLGRAEQYADILARAADMFDEPLAQEIRVPD
jgi:hypothetical protein